MKGVHFAGAPAPEAARLLEATPARFTAAAHEAMARAKGAISRLKALPVGATAEQALCL